MWECLNATWNALPGAAALRALGRPARVLQLRGGPRRDVRRAGRLHDVAATTVAVLPARAVGRAGGHDRAAAALAGGGPGARPRWVTVLRCAGAADTYLRTYRGALDARRVVQFLLLDRLFPRSVFHALRRPRCAWPSWTTGRSCGSGPRPRRCGCSAGRAPSWSSCGPTSCCDDLPHHLTLPSRRRVRGVGEAVPRASTSTRRRGWPGPHRRRRRQLGDSDRSLDRTS